MREINQPGYHHGNLRGAIITAALQAIGESGPAGWSLRERAAHVLATSARRLSPSSAHDRLTTIAAWSLAHGFAGLWLSGSLPESAQGDPEAIARSLVQLVFDPMNGNASE